MLQERIFKVHSMIMITEKNPLAFYSGTVMTHPTKVTDSTIGLFRYQISSSFLSKHCQRLWGSGGFHDSDQHCNIVCMDSSAPVYT